MQYFKEHLCCIKWGDSHFTPSSSICARGLWCVYCLLVSLQWGAGKEGRGNPTVLPWWACHAWPGEQGSTSRPFGKVNSVASSPASQPWLLHFLGICMHSVTISNTVRWFWVQWSGGVLQSLLTHFGILNHPIERAVGFITGHFITGQYHSFNCSQW